MRAVIQRVSLASVEVDGAVVGAIAGGLLVLVAVVPGDTAADARALVDKTVHLRVFDDDDGRMNRSLLDVGGSVLVVSQFTLAADVRKGRRPSFTGAGDPAMAEPMVDRIVSDFASHGINVQTGIFGARMSVHSVNDGPVTFVVDVADGSVVSLDGSAR